MNPLKSDGSALSLKRWWRSMGFAFAGFRSTYQTQANFRVELVAAVLALGFGLWLKVGLAPILFCCALVLSLELLNSALEAVVDLVSPEIHPLAKKAKDAAAAAVLMASLGAVGVALVVLAPPLWALFIS